MSTLRRVSFRLAILTLCASMPEPREAQACATVHARAEVHRPSLSYEQVLLAWDSKSQKEHLVRQVIFDDAATSFGFLVPTPSLPEVATVATSPFATLRRSFPYVDPTNVVPAVGRSVDVVDVKKLGKLTAFVLRADDAAALASWLSENGLTSNPETDRWLERYVKQKFYLVAVRYDAPPKATAGMASETVRISFTTPAPYYPYLEPSFPKGARAVRERGLSLWLVTDLERVPVALFDDGTHREWVRPLRVGVMKTFPPVPLSLEAPLQALMPTGRFTMQTYRDQKVSREGYGDLLFLPVQRLEGDARRRHAEALEPLLGVLDPSLLVAR